MAKKSNIRSIRFSDEIIEIIEAQKGETFTAKFESLIRKCYQEVPAKERELESLQARIEKERKSYTYVQKEVGNLRSTVISLNYTLESLTRQLNTAVEEAEKNLGIK